MITALINVLCFLPAHKTHPNPEFSGLHCFSLHIFFALTINSPIPSSSMVQITCTFLITQYQTSEVSWGIIQNSSDVDGLNFTFFFHTFLPHEEPTHGIVHPFTSDLHETNMNIVGMHMAGCTPFCSYEFAITCTNGGKK